jgi:hypothetical protein
MEAPPTRGVLHKVQTSLPFTDPPKRKMALSGGSSTGVKGVEREAVQLPSPACEAEGARLPNLTFSILEILQLDVSPCG